MFQRVHIMGAAGAGKTTLGMVLAGRLHVQCMDTDEVYWLPSQPPFLQKRDIRERINLLEQIISGSSEGIILTGSLSGWGSPLIPLFDGVIFLDTPTPIRLKRLNAREIERYGAHPSDSTKAKSAAFLDWAAAYDAGTHDGRSRERDEAWLADLSVPVIRLDGSRPLGDLTEIVLSWMRSTPARTS